MFRQFNKYRDSEGEEEYLGNIWGWKVSFIGLGLLLFLIGLYAYRIHYHPQLIEEPPKDKIEITH